MNTRIHRLVMRTGLITVLLLGGTLARAQDAAELARCSTIGDAGKRLACYDAVSRGETPEAQPAPAPPEPESPPAEPAKPDSDVAVLTDEIGEEQLDRDGDPGEEQQAVRGSVTNCQQDASGRYYFYFDNGQVWKQKDSDRLPFRDCNFDVTIERDFFGYKMRADGYRGDIRISRVR